MDFVIKFLGIYRAICVSTVSPNLCNNLDKYIQNMIIFVFKKCRLFYVQKYVKLITSILPFMDLPFEVAFWTVARTSSTIFTSNTIFKSQC